PVAGTLSGIQNVCAGSTTTFSSTITGGSWSSGNTAVATIDPTTGVINGLTAGTSTMTYTVAGAGGCGNATVTRTVTVNAEPIAGTLSGTQNICSGSSTTFSSTISGGNWSSGNTSIATIDPSTGLVTGVTAGTVTMTYTVTGIGGCSDAVATRTITLTVAPDAGTLSGNQNICVGGTSTFISTTTGGTWSSNAASIATVDPSTGVINGLAAGTATISYTVAGAGGCGNATVTRNVIVTAAPSPGVLSGNQNICLGSTSAFSSTVSGGTWSSSDPSVATIDPGSGLVTSVANGSATMTYTVSGTGNCADVSATRNVAVSSVSSAGTLRGTQDVCLGGTTNFYSTIEGGSWTSSDNAIATIDEQTGMITGVSGGTATITYSITGTGGCSTVTNTRSVAVSVSPAPVSGTLSGVQHICTGSNTTFSSTESGGHWDSDNTGVATIDPATGEITGISAGTATMTYTVTGTGVCADAIATRTVTVTAAPIAGILGGNQNVCVGSTTTFNSTIAGGVWTSDQPGVATIDPSTGLINGVGAGTATMTYTVAGNGGCGDAIATRVVTVTAAPVAGTLSGSGNICVGSNTTFSSTVLGGSWSSSNLAVATIDATGQISALSAGTSTITYTVSGTGGCGNATVTKVVTVTAAPVAGTLSGTRNICIGSTSTFSSTETGGVWSSDNTSVATIDPSTGLINGLGSGTATMTYTVTGTGGCSDAVATRTVTVTAAAVAGTLSGVQSVCIGNGSTFSSTISGGSWSSGNTAVATINASTGEITALTAGTATMTYTVPGSGGCGNATDTRVITVTAPVTAGTLGGNQSICVGSTTTFNSTINGGSWSSGNTVVATIDPSTGLINGLGSGTATMTYTVTGTGGCGDAIATRTVTVTAAPIAGTLGGNQNVCVGSTTTFNSTIAGGVWTSDQPGVATIDPSTGLINGFGAGTATMTYTVAGNGGCGDAIATRVVTVTAAPVAGTLSGSGNICVGSTATFSSTVLGGTWSSSNSAVASIDAAGQISALSAGTSTITYTVSGTGGCGNAMVTKVVTVTAAPVAGTLSGTGNICIGSTSTFSSTETGGVWSSDNTSVATIDPSTGLINGLGSGTATMTYTVTGTGGCSDAVATRTITVTAAPVAGTLSGTRNICIGSTSTFSSTETGGVWSSDNTSVATIDPSTGLINGLGSGTATMTYTVTGTGGCSDAIATRTVTVTAAPIAGTLGGNQSICVGSTTTFNSTINGGSWSSGNTAVATIDPSTGLINGLGSGTVTMTYTVIGTGGCGDAIATRTVTVTAAPIAGTLGGNQNVCVGGTTTFNSTIAGGIWTSDQPGVSTIDPSTGLINGVGAGTATMTYTVAGNGGCGDAIA
uniref:beta strand repeat-containing protein n=1 Tax=Pedobacter gandavensis TaxID=2679963 RepID=UPI00292F66A9